MTDATGVAGEVVEAVDARELTEALSDPAFYDPEPPAVERRETHISRVFLAGERVYKVKKPVVFPFLDYGTPERRRSMCEEEMRLNRRLADDVYLAVRPIVRRGGLALGEPGAPDGLEWVVEMRRLPEGLTLERLIEDGGVADDRIAEVARRLARFHAEAEVAPEEAWATRRLKALFDDDLGSLASAAGPRLERRRYRALERFLHAGLAGLGGVIEERGRRGLFRDGHGDLRLDHVVLEEEGIQIVDCVEFDPWLRYVDVGDDLAFLVMDLLAHGAESVARTLVAEYRAAGGDPGDDRLVAFWTCYRAMVRAKIAYLRAPATDGANAAAERTEPEHDPDAEEAELLIELAERSRWRVRLPLVIVTHGDAPGEPAHGGALARASGLPLLAARDGDTPEHVAAQATAAVERTGGAIVQLAPGVEDGGSQVAATLSEAGHPLLLVECRPPGRGHEPAGTVAAEGPAMIGAGLTPEEAVDEIEALLDARLAWGA